MIYKIVADRLPVTPPLGIGDEAWIGVSPLTLVAAMIGDDKPRWTTSVQIATSPAALEVRFNCAANTFRATMQSYKDRVWQEDAVEVYLAPPDHRYLFEFQLSPLGVSRDLLVQRPGELGQIFDDRWCCAGLRCSAQVTYGEDQGVTGWQGLFSVPWNGLAASAESLDWMIGAFRIERDPLEYSALTSVNRETLELHDSRYLLPLVSVV